MARYSLSIKRCVAKDLRSIPNQEVVRLLERIEALTKNPRPPGCEKISGQERYRVRQGPYRIIHEIRDEESVVTIVKVSHRRDVYRSG
jgi:mRNA interferase RelE/StbE